jgi:hypothetical protein
VYRGTLKNGLFHGSGTLEVLLPASSYPPLPAGAPVPRTTYTGAVFGGNADGAGTITFASGIVYSGGVLAGAPNGMGKMTIPPTLVWRGGIVPSFWSPAWAGDAAAPNLASFDPNIPTINGPAVQMAFEALGVLELPSHGISTSSAMPVPLGPDGAPRPLLFGDVATAASALQPSPGSSLDSPKAVMGPGPGKRELQRVASPSVRVICSEWRAGQPKGATAYESHGGVTFRGYLLPENGRIFFGWPCMAFGVLRVTKPKPGPAGPRVVQEAGFFYYGMLNCKYGLRSYTSKTGEERSKYGNWLVGAYSPSFSKNMQYLRLRSFAAKPKDALTKSLKDYTPQ